MAAAIPAIIAAVSAGAAVQSSVQARKGAKSAKQGLERRRAGEKKAADQLASDEKSKRDLRLKRSQGLGGTLLTGGRGVNESGLPNQKLLLGE